MSASGQLKIVKFLAAHPDWHTGLDIVKDAGVSRWSIYANLAALQDMGLVERKDVGTRAGHSRLPASILFRGKLVKR